MEFNYMKFKSFLGNDFVEEYVQSYLLENEYFEIYDDGTNDIYYISKEKGIDYLFDNNVNTLELKAVFIYINNSKEGYKPFSEKLPFSMEKYFSKTEVNKLLGVPDKSIEALPIIKKNYSEIYNKLGYSIGIEYCEEEQIKFLRIEIIE